MKLAELLEGLPNDRLAAIEVHLGRLQAPDRSMAVQALTVIGAWFAAFFLLGFLGLAGMVKLSSGGPDLFIGLLLIGGAVFMARAAFGLFTDQLALALSVAGHILVFIAAWSHSLAGPASAACVLAALLYRVYPGGLHRFLSVATALSLVLAWVADDARQPGLYLLLAAQIVALARVPSRERALAYALALSTLTTTVVIDSTVPVWPATVIFTATLLAETCFTAPEMAPRVRAMLRVAAVLLGLLSTPGIIGALALLVLAHDRDDPALVAIALAFLAGFIVHFYYSLDLGLGTKSYMLMASGVVLLAVRRLAR